MFFSSSNGFLVDFIYKNYSAHHLIANKFLFPRGDFIHPFYDLEQGWIVEIAEQNEFVYILYGIYEQVSEGVGYHTWFKVDKQRYYDQWEKAIALCHKTFQKENEKKHSQNE